MELNIPFVLNLFSAILTFLLALLSLKLIKRRGGISFGMLSLSLTLWSLGKLLRNNVPFDHPKATALVELYSQISFAGVAGLTPWFFLLTYRITPQKSKLQKISAYLAIPLWIITLVLEQQGYLHLSPVQTEWGWSNRTHGWYPFFVVVFFYYLLMGGVALYPKNFSKRWAGHRQTQFLFWGIISTVILGMPEFYSVLVGPIFPIADISPAAFAGVLYLGIFRYDYLGGQGFLLGFGVKIIYYFFLTLVLTLGIWIYQHLFLESALSGWLLTATGALLIFVLTPMVSNFNHYLQEKIFPVKAAFIKAHQTLTDKLRNAQRPEDSIQILLEVLKDELGFKEILLIQDPKYASHDEHTVFGLREILSRVRFQQEESEDLGPWWGKYKLLRRYRSDMGMHLSSKQRWYGIVFIQESKVGLEHWHTINPLLESLVQKTADHCFLLDMVESNHRQQQIAEMGIMAAQLAHEIKNPLQGIHGATQLLIEEFDGNPFLEIVKNDTQRLNHIVQNFLDFARPYDIQPKEIHLKSFFDNWVSKKQQLSQGVYFNSPSLNTQHAELVIQSDSDALTQILDNLLQNALRHGSSEQPPELKVQVLEVFVEIKVRDFGAGVAPNNRNKLFRPFFSTHAQGNGLGLAYCAKLAKALNGELSYTSCEPGSEFSLRLPKHHSL